MKKKYILSGPYIEYEEECLKLFNKMSNGGWALKKADYFFIFEKSDKKLKYQMDYTERDDEYNEIVKEMGYSYLGTCRKVHFYASEDLDAPDLVSDPSLTKQIISEHHPIWGIVLLVLLGFITFKFSINSFLNALDSLGKFYLLFDQFISGITSMALVLFCLISALIEYKKRKTILHGTYSFSKFYRIDKASFYGFIIFIIVMTILEYIRSYSIIKSLQSILIVLILMLVNYISFYPIETEGTKNKRFLLRIVLIIVAVATQMIVHSWDDAPDYKDIPENFPIIDSYRVEENPFVYRVYFLPIVEDTLGSIYYSCYYECKDSQIASTIFEELVVEMESISHYPTQEEIDTLYDQTGKYWEYDDAIKKSYPDAVSQMSVFETDSVDDCYYLDQSVIFKKDNMIVEVVNADHSEIESYISKLLNFYQSTPHYK